jgi:hypothetical protein
VGGLIPRCRERRGVSARHGSSSGLLNGWSLHVQTSLVRPGSEQTLGGQAILTRGSLSPAHHVFSVGQPSIREHPQELQSLLRPW